MVLLGVLRLPMWPDAKALPASLCYMFSLTPIQEVKIHSSAVLWLSFFLPRSVCNVGVSVGCTEGYLSFQNSAGNYIFSGSGCIIVAAVICFQITK